MNLKLTVLGNNSAIPCFGRHPSAQILTVHNHLILIDCGEGTQMQLEEYGIKKMKIEHIFISHLHGDHVFGLPGLLTTFSLLRRTKPLTIFGPKGLEQMIMNFLGHSRAIFSYELHFIEVVPNTKTMILDHPDIQVYAFPVNHGIQTNGYLFEENLTRLKLRTEALKEYNIPEDIRTEITLGKDFTTEENLVIQNELLTYPPRKPMSYAYCTDTSPLDQVAEWVNEATLLYHETTYLDDMKIQAKERFHTTTKQAAEIAKKAKVGHLLIGHFSSRYAVLTPLLEECRSVFADTILSTEGSTIDLNELLTTNP